MTKLETSKGRGVSAISAKDEAPAQATEAGPPPERPVFDKPDQHAFVVTGTRTLFLCHLTMLHMEDHMYQVVLKARLPDNAMRDYLEDSEKHPRATYFLGNASDDLMTNPDIASGARRAFIGTMWRGIPDRPVSEGWPWKGTDTPVICDHVEVEIERVVYYRHFDFNLNYPDTLTYFMFGSGTEAHLYHYQVKYPEFDSVVSLKKAPTWLAPRLLEAGVPVNFPSFPNKPDDGGPTYCNNPLKPGVHRVQYGGPRPKMEGPDDEGGGPVTAGFTIEVGRTLWFNTKLTNMMDPCKGKGEGGGG